MTGSLTARLERLEALHAHELAGMPGGERSCVLNCGELGSHRDCPIHGDVPYRRSSLAPSPDYRTRDTQPPPLDGPVLTDPEPCGCEEAEALRARLAKAERRAALWHKVARMKSRLLLMSEPPRFDSQLTRPVQGG